MNYQEGEKLRKSATKGITLIALVVTIVVLLILAGITIQLVLADGGILGQAQNASEQYKIAQARERIEITLGNAQIDKATNEKYNENEYLDKLIVQNTANTKVIDELVFVDGYVFELDRSVPKLGEYIGKESELIFPQVTVNSILANDSKTATIIINAKEETNGISKIEIWQDGFVIETYTYDNIKELVTENYIAKQNGTYIIKVYSKLKVTEETEIKGIIASVEYIPNGNEEYKKEHQVKVTVNEETEKVKSIKYQWLNTTVEPEASTFITACNNGDTLTKNELTGKYYLWTLLELESGKTRIERSEAFYLDNQGPDVTVTSEPLSESSFKMVVNAKDEHNGKIKKYEFYVDDKLVNKQDLSEEKAEYTAIEVETGEKSCYVIVTDELGNSTRQNFTAKTKMFTWKSYSTDIKDVYTYSLKSKNRTSTISGYLVCCYGKSFVFNEETSNFVLTNYTKSTWDKVPVGNYIVGGSTGESGVLNFLIARDSENPYRLTCDEWVSSSKTSPKKICRF